MTCGWAPHDADNLYKWNNPPVPGTAPSGLPDGTLFTDFLAQLNNCYLDLTGAPTIVGGLGGHCDWRLPTLDELNGLIALSATGCPALGIGCVSSFTYPGPCIDPIFAPNGDIYVSGTSEAGTDFIFVSNFSSGSTATATMDWDKTRGIHARAVRGGS